VADIVYYHLKGHENATSFACAASRQKRNIWENVELPALKANKNVTEISTIDPKTLKETVIYKRPK
jgi:hypothetical protein